MSNDIASLGLKVDSSEVSRANRELDNLADSAGKAEVATKGVGAASESAAHAVNRNSRAILTHIAHLAELDPRLRTAAILISHLGASVGAIAGIGAAVAGVAILVKAYLDGAHEAEGFAIAIASTGNAAGLTTNQLIEMARRIDGVVGTQQNASRGLALLASSGKVAAENLERFTTVAIQLERSVGTPIEETAKKFADLATEPTKAAAELQKTLNFLTPAIYATIRAQEEAGDVAGAAATAQKAFAEAGVKAARDVEGELNALGRGWRFVKDQASEAWDAMSGIGRKLPDELILKQLEAERRLPAMPSIGQFTNTARLDEQIAALKASIAEKKRDADASREQKAATDSYIDSLAKAAKFEDVWKQINAAWDTFDSDKVKRGLQAVLSEYEGLNKELEAQHDAQLIDDQEFFKRRGELIKKSVAIEIAALKQANAALSVQPKDNFSVEGIDRQNKIADNEARIALLRKQSASQLRVVETQQKDDLRKTAIAYAEAQQAADRYVETLTKRFQIESQGLGLGEEARQRMRDRADLEARFQDRIDQIEQDHRRGQIKDDVYEQLLAVEKNALARSERAYDEHYKALKEKQGDWVVGAAEAFANFADDAANVAKHIEDVFGNALNGLADSIVQFAMTGKGNFKDLVNSVIADLLRMEAKIALSKLLKPVFESIAGSIGNLFTTAPTTGGGATNSGFVGPRASGGPVRAGSTYLVNEDTPRSEYFTPTVDGFITPRSGMGGGPVVNAVFNFGAGSSVATTQAMVQRGLAELRNEIFENMRRGRWQRVTG